MAKKTSWVYLTTARVAKLMAEDGEPPAEWGCCPETLSEEQREWLGLDKQPVPEGARRVYSGSDPSYIVQFVLPKAPAARLPEFYPPDGGDDPLLSYRRHRFLQAVERKVPGVLEDLFSRLQAAKDARGEVALQEIVRDRWDEPGAVLLGGQKGLKEWAERFHLNEGWVLRAADDTLKAWLGVVMVPVPSGRGATRWNLVHRIGPGLDYHDVLRVCRFDFQGFWFPVDRESHAFAELRLRFEFETALQHHLDRIEKLHEDRGYKRTREALTPRSDTILVQHCEWLALFQCGGKEWREIAGMYPATKDYPVKSKNWKPIDPQTKKRLEEVKVSPQVRREIDKSQPVGEISSSTKMQSTFRPENRIDHVRRKATELAQAIGLDLRDS